MTVPSMLPPDRWHVASQAWLPHDDPAFSQPRSRLHTVAVLITFMIIFGILLAASVAA